MNKRKCKHLCKLLFIAAMLGLFLLPLRPQSQNQSLKSFDPAPDWRPTHAPANASYVGNATCAECHNEVTTQPTTPMGIALETAATSRILTQHKELTFKNGALSYSIRRNGEQSIYSVTDGKESLSVPVLYVFGQGKAGQTYVLEHNGKLFESRISFFNATGGLDFTMGASRAVPNSLEAALGRVLDAKSIKDCFSCHATAAISQGQLQLDKMNLGVTCEGCHGAGEKHVSLMKMKPKDGVTGRQGDKAILNPGHFDTEGQAQFCGACHRSWIQVQTMGVRGVENVRFQPYRIFNSKCYDYKDKRINCTACHNPHEEIKSDKAFYDAKCLACHQPEKQAAKTQTKIVVCPKAKQDCVSCHMPKTEIPGIHFKFTDHQIRVVRAGEPYPN